MLRTKQIITLSAAILLLILAWNLNNLSHAPEIKISKQQAALNINSKFLLFFSLGQNRLLADLLWISTLLESDINHYQEKNLNSWMFLRFKSITELDPFFLRAFQFGGKYLAIVKDDLDGARYIYEKGLSSFPRDYELISDLAFTLAFEIGDYESAIKYYTIALEFPEHPSYIDSLILKLRFQKAQSYQDIYPVILNMYKRESTDSALKNKLKLELYAIKSEIDLKCLNGRQPKNCNKFDFYNQKYKYSQGKYSTLRPYAKYKFHIHK